MKNSGMFFINLIMSIIRYAILLIAAIVLIIIGATADNICLYIGFGILALYLILCAVSVFRMQRMVNYRSDDDPEFNEMMDKFSADPKAFLSDIMNAQEENKKLHGEALLNLSDDDLWETVYLQNIDIEESAEDEEKALDLFSGARRTVYILGLFDAEIQNGGLCQFFVNSSSAVAPFVSECLETVGAYEHKTLFDEFIGSNSIDVCDLESFKVFSKRGYINQTKRFDYDSFDDKYYDLPALQEKATAYIRDNINEF